MNSRRGLRSAISLFAALIFAAVTASSALAADCERCGKKLKWGSGTCAQCKLEVLRGITEPVADAVNEAITEAAPKRLEKSIEAVVMDGTVHQFQPTGTTRYRGRDARRVLFVNGMRTDFDVFTQDTQRLANVIGRPVTGIYSGGITRGVASSVALQIDNWSQGTGYAQRLPDGRALISELDRASDDGKDVILICYSRGTMLTEAIVKSHRWARDHATIYAFGCAVSSAFPVREYYKIVNRDDDLMRDRMIDTRNLVWGIGGSHDFMDYLDNLEHGRFDRELPLMEGPFVPTWMRHGPSGSLV